MGFAIDGVTLKRIETPEMPLFININHPCYEVDMTRATCAEEEKLLRGQGYMSIEELRELCD